MGSVAVFNLSGARFNFLKCIPILYAYAFKHVVFLYTLGIFFGIVLVVNFFEVHFYTIYLNY